MKNQTIYNPENMEKHGKTFKIEKDAIGDINLSDGILWILSKIFANMLCKWKICVNTLRKIMQNIIGKTGLGEGKKIIILSIWKTCCNKLLDVGMSPTTVA